MKTSRSTCIYSPSTSINPAVCDFYGDWCLVYTSLSYGQDGPYVIYNPNKHSPHRNPPTYVFMFAILCSQTDATTINP